MAAIVVTNSNLRLDDFEGAVSGTTNRGGGAGVQTEPDFVYQNVQAWSRKVSASGGAGWWWTDGVTTDMTAAADNTWVFKVQTTNKDALNSFGMRIGVGDTTSDNYEYLIHDDGTQGDNGEFAYPIKGGWVLGAVNPNVTAWRDFTNGTPTLTAVDVFGIIVGLGATSKGENLIWDAIDIGPGLFLVDGAASTAGVFNDFVVHDQGTLANRFGHVSTNESGLVVFGKLVIGRNSGDTFTTETIFSDTLQTLVWPGGLVDAGYNGIEVELDDVDTDVLFDTCTFSGSGRNNLKVFFDSELNVTGGATDAIDTVAHGFNTGDAVLYSIEGGTVITGLTDNTEYFVERTDADNFQLHTTRQNAFTAATPIGLTPAGAGTGERHSLRRQPDTRPDVTITGPATKLGTFLSDGCSYINFRSFTLDEGSTIQGGTLVNPFSLTLNSGTLDDVLINSPLLAPGEAFVNAQTLVNIDNNQFVAGDAGHAIEIDATGVFGFVGNTFTGYGPGTASDTGVHDNEFDTITDVDAAGDTVTLGNDNFATGDPVFYNDEGGTDTIGLTDGNLYYVRRTAANTIAFYETFEAANTDTNRIGLSDGSTGETHTIYSANAAIVNNSGGSVTVQVSGGGSTPTIRNVGASSTIVENNVSLTLTGLRDNTEVRVCDASSGVALAGVENATDGTSDDRSVTFSLAAGILVDIRFAHGTAADGNVYLVPPSNALEDFTWPSSTTSLPITQILDRTFSNP